MRTSTGAAVVAAALLASTVPALGAPRARDTWYAFVDHGRRYGALHVTVVRLPDGDYRITTDVRLRVNVLGVNREEITHHTDHVVTPEYRTVSIRGEGSNGSGPIRVSAQRNGTALALSATSAGLERSRRFERADSLLPAACLDDWLADRPAEFESGAVQVLDEEAGEVATARIRRLPSSGPGTSWSIETGQGSGEQRVVLDRDGVRLEASMESGLTRMVRCSAEEARDLTVRVLDGRDLLMFPLDKEIGEIDRLESLTVEVRWKQIDPSRFRLEDDRQRVVERSQDGGSYRAVVRIEAPRPIDRPVRLPIDAPEFAAALGESQYIKPHDPKIVAVAGEVTKGKTDALEAVRALASWVSSNVEVAYNARTLSGPEVLACRKGKCSEFATLFASLARAAGIPTRIVLGERLLPGQWGGHMWNEVYVGRWIPVDAGYNEVGRSFALLKLCDDDSVEGVSSLRFALPASLELRIVDHRSTAPPRTARYKTGIEGRVYTNAEFGYRLTMPADGWTIVPAPTPGVAASRLKVPGRDDVQVHVVALSVPKAIEPKYLLNVRRKYYESKLKGLEYLVDEACTVNALAGHRHVFRHAPEMGKPLRSHEVVLRRGGTCFLLALSLPESAYDEFLPGFTRLLASLEDLEQQR